MFSQFFFCETEFSFLLLCTVNEITTFIFVENNCSFIVTVPMQLDVLVCFAEILRNSEFALEPMGCPGWTELLANLGCSVIV